MATLRFAFSFLILAAAFYGFAEFLSDRWPLDNPMHIVEAILFGVLLLIASWLLVDYTVRSILRYKHQRKQLQEDEARTAREWDEARRKLTDMRSSGDRHPAVSLSGQNADFDGAALPDLLIDDSRTPA